MRRRLAGLAVLGGPCAGRRTPGARDTGPPAARVCFKLYAFIFLKERGRLRTFGTLLQSDAHFCGHENR